MTTTDEKNLKASLVNLVRSVAKNANDSPYYVGRVAQSLMDEIVSEEFQRRESSNDGAPK